MGNPAARHSLGEEARESLRAARAKVGRLVGGRPEGVVFLSGATEANNLAVKGVALRGPGGHVVTTAIEHPSILAPCRDLIKAGLEVTAVAVDAEGRVSPDDVRRALKADTCLVTLGAANGETGTVQPWRAIAAVTREAGVPLHLDGGGGARAVAPRGRRRGDRPAQRERERPLRPARRRRALDSAGASPRAPATGGRAGRGAALGNREPGGRRGARRGGGVRLPRRPGGGRPPRGASRPAGRRASIAMSGTRGSWGLAATGCPSTPVSSSRA